MRVKKKQIKSKFVKIDFENGDGTVDEWVYDVTKSPRRAVEVTSNIRRRGNFKS
jgi:hypothetical protein